MKVLNWFFVIFFSLSWPCASKAGGDGLIDTLQHESDVNVIYNEINHVEWSAENMDVVQALWEKNRQRYPDLPWEKLDDDIVKLALANVLMQAHRHCRIEANMGALHDFVKSKTMSSDLRVKGRATYLLGLSGYEEDIPYLSSIVELEREGYAEEAALSLTFIHSGAALNAIRNLESKVKRPSLKSFLKDLVEKYQSYALVDRSKGCEK